MIRETTLLLSIVLGSCLVSRAGELADLQAQRVETLQQAVRLIEPQYQAGEATIQQLLDAHAALLDAKLDAVSTSAQRIEALTQQLKLSATAEKVADTRFRAGQVKQSDFFVAKAARLRVEVLLAKEKVLGGEDAGSLGLRDPGGRFVAELESVPLPFQSRQATIKELCEILAIQTYAGQFRLDGKCSKLRFVVEGHRDGKQVFSASSGDVGDGQGEATIGPGVCSYRVRILDSDTLPHAPVKPKNHHRLNVQVQFESAAGSLASKDISDETFDLGLLNAANAELTHDNPHRRGPLIAHPGEKKEIFRIGLPNPWDVDSGKAVPANGYLAAYFVSE